MPTEPDDQPEEPNFEDLLEVLANEDPADLEDLEEIIEAEQRAKST